jgi:hypothetical protein
LCLYGRGQGAFDGVASTVFRRKHRFLMEQSKIGYWAASVTEKRTRGLKAILGYGETREGESRYYLFYICYRNKDEGRRLPVCVRRPVASPIVKGNNLFARPQFSPHLVT